MDVDPHPAMGDDFGGADAEDEMNDDSGEREMKEEAEDPYSFALKRLKRQKKQATLMQMC